MKHRAGLVDLRAVGNQLSDAPHIATDLVLNQQLIISASLLPESPAGQRKFSGTKSVVRDKPAIAKTPKQTYSLLHVFIPGDINALGRPNYFWIKFGLQKPVDCVHTYSRLCVCSQNPQRGPAANANILAVVF